LLIVNNVSYKPDLPALFRQGEKNKFILKNISFDLKEGNILGISGESGGGKTTLAKIISGIIKPTSGNIIFTQKNSSSNRKSNVQILFQNNDELINPLRTVGNILKDGAYSENYIAEICALTGLEENLLGKKGYQLSGGERQRVALANILSAKPKLLVLDEPFSAQDPGSQNHFVELFRKINSEMNMTMICISHDISILKSLSHQTAIMYEGEILELSNTADLYKNPKHPYTRFLLKSNEYSLNRGDFASGEKIMGAACSFYNRCSRRSDECLEVVKKTETKGHITLCNNPF